MKVHYLLVLSLGFSLTSKAQTEVYQENNNVRAYLSGVGTFFANDSAQQPRYEVPIGSGINAIYSTQFWFAGRDITGQLKMAAGGSPGIGTDVFNGPLSDPGTYSTPEYQNRWSRHVWSICQSDIDNYDLKWRCENVPGTVGCENVQIPSTEVLNTIMTWPGNGNVAMGQSAQLAPFIDRNGDGIYDPASGDLPDIKGCCATYLIQNDMAGLHTYSNGEPTRVEMHYLFYQYANWNYLNDVTFVDVMAVNKSGMTYQEFAISMMVDADLGFFSDDYMGADSLKNTLFFYNGDNLDETNGATSGYGTNPPALGIVALEENATAIVPLINSPTTPLERWNIMKGLQTSGAPFTNPNGQATTFFLNGNPNDTSQWSEVTMGNNPGDRRAIISTQVNNFQFGDTLKQTFAITYARTGDHLQNVQSLLDISDDIQVFHDTQSETPCENGILATEELLENVLTVYPNPSSGIVYVASSASELTHIEVYNSAGQLIKNETVKTANYQLDLSKEQPGLYLLQIQTEFGTKMKKIVLE